MANPLTERLIKNSTIKKTTILGDSKIFQPKTFYDTGVPIINLALSADTDKGLFAGLTVIAGPSKHFKTKFALEILRGFLASDPDAVGIIYDNEFGSPAEYFEASGIDTDRVVYTPIMDMEEFKFDVIKQLNGLKETDKVIIILDSIGNLASKKELDDALEGESKQDMTRAKILKSIFRMIVPYLHTKEIPFIGIGHTYQTQEMYSKAVVSGGTGAYYGADNIWILGRQQNKDGKEIAGFDYIINVEKSRYVKEKSKFPIKVMFDRGIDKWSGMLDVAEELGYIAKPAKGKYSIVNQETGELSEKTYKEDEINYNDDFWREVMTPKFKQSLKEHYGL